MTEEAKRVVAGLRNFSVSDTVEYATEIVLNARKSADMIESLSKQCDDQNEMLHWAYGILKKLDKGLEEHGFDSFEEVYAQLEQVTRERDAAIKYIDKDCETCAHLGEGEYVSNVCMVCIRNCNWQWRGVEVNNDAQKGFDAKS